MSRESLDGLRLAQSFLAAYNRDFLCPFCGWTTPPCPHLLAARRLLFTAPHDEADRLRGANYKLMETNGRLRQERDEAGDAAAKHQLLHGKELTRRQAIEEDLSGAIALYEEVERERNEWKLRAEAASVADAHDRAEAAERKLDTAERAAVNHMDRAEAAERERDELKARATANWDSYEDSQRRVEALEAELRELEVMREMLR